MKTLKFNVKKTEESASVEINCNVDCTGITVADMMDRYFASAVITVQGQIRQGKVTVADLDGKVIKWQDFGAIVKVDLAKKTAEAEKAGALSVKMGLEAAIRMAKVEDGLGEDETLEPARYMEVVTRFMAG